ncbi:hypothetical protein AVEN_202016-1, partial [Araneus ventricosus]
SSAGKYPIFEFQNLCWGNKPVVGPNGVEQPYGECTASNLPAKVAIFGHKAT